MKKTYFFGKNIFIALFSLLVIAGIGFAAPMMQTGQATVNFEKLGPGDSYGDACGNGISNSFNSYNSVTFTVDHKGCLVTANVMGSTTVYATTSNVEWSLASDGNLNINGNANRIVIIPSANGFFLNINGNTNVIRLGSMNGQVFGDGVSNKVIFP